MSDRTLKRDILVTGPHRSGTTWVGNTLCVNRGTELLYEPFNLDITRNNFSYRFRNWFEHVPLSPEKRMIEAEFDRYLSPTGFRRALTTTRGSGRGILSPFIFARQLLFQSERPRYILKDPIALMSAGWLYERYGLNVICITRNPLAFAGSLKQQGWDFEFQNFLNQQEFMQKYFPKDIATLESLTGKSSFAERVAHLWNVLNRMILYYRKAYPEWHFTTHESVAKNPLEEFQKMYHYCGLAFTDDVREYIDHYTSEKNPGSVASNTYQPRNALETIHTWKARLNSEEVKCIKEITQDVYKDVYGMPISELLI